MDDLHRLLENNRQWVRERLDADPEYFTRNAKSQTPEFLFIGCSDSRVPANEITGTHPGEMFVHRNIANQVWPNDINVLSVLQYAVEVLDVRHVIVCGHYECGGVKAAAQSEAHYGLVDNWLGEIRTIERIHRHELDALPDHRRAPQPPRRAQRHLPGVQPHADARDPAGLGTGPPPRSSTG